MSYNNSIQGNMKRQQNFEGEEASKKRSRPSWPPVHQAQHPYVRQTMHTPSSSPRPVSVSSLPRNLQSPRSNVQHLVRPVHLVDAEWGKVTTKILRHFQAEQQSPDRYAKKMQLRDALFAIVKNVFPYSGLYMVGSSLNGFGSNSSDMDLCLMMTHLPINQKTEAREILCTLQRSFRCCKFLKDLRVIRATVPILTFHDDISGIECDLNINNEIGIRNTHLLNAYSQLDRRLSPLVVFVKYWAKVQTINDASQGTISSYSLVLMVIHYLQAGCSPAVLPSLQVMYPQSFSSSKDVRTLKLGDKVPSYNSPNKQSLGELFYGFLDYYTNIFDFQEDAISVRLGTKVPRHVVCATSDKPAQWKWICIEEPFDLCNTARSVYDEHVFGRIMRVIRRSFADVRQTRCVDNIISVPM